MSRVISIVTWYHPAEENVSNAKLIASQSDSIVICDNSAQDNSSYTQGIKNCKYFSDHTNLGLSKAFNRVLRDSSMDWQEDDFIIFFDQDSKIPPSHIEKLMQEYKVISKEKSIGCIGPVYFDVNEGQEQIPAKREYINDKTFKCTSIITSSLLCQYGKLQDVGYWNEDIFLDLADWDLCWRFMSHGYAVCMTNVSIIKHAVGQDIKKIGCFKFRQWAPFREYYQTRDCLKLLGKDYVPLKYKAKFMLIFTVKPIVHLLFLPHGVERVKYVAKGMLDFFRGKDEVIK